jgi:hypothetical protein
MATLQKQLLCTLKRPYKRSFLIQMALHVSWTTLQEQIFAKLRRPYRSEANMNEVGHGQDEPAQIPIHPNVLLRS